MTLAANNQRVYEELVQPDMGDLPVKGSTHIYEGGAISATSGLARPLNIADAFAGFAEREADNSSGADSDITVRLRQRGFILLDVAAGGVLANSAADEHLPVYATDDTTFTGLVTSALQIGKIVRYVSSGKYIVYFEALALRSI